MATDFESLIDDYAASQHFLFLDGAVREHAAGMLTAFAAACSRRGVREAERLSASVFDAVMLNDFPRLDLPLDVRLAAPGLVEQFFDYLAESGRFPAAVAWGEWVKAIDVRYRALFREDGSVKGETFKKKYTNVNRNDPCPCGSGKKFKKCCMDLIS
jgi:hypothetical protein